MPDKYGFKIINLYNLKFKNFGV